MTPATNTPQTTYQYGINACFVHLASIRAFHMKRDELCVRLKHKVQRSRISSEKEQLSHKNTSCLLQSSRLHHLVQYRTDSHHIYHMKQKLSILQHRPRPQRILPISNRPNYTPRSLVLSKPQMMM